MLRDIIMKNISSINHTNFARLHELTNNYNKATLLDKLIFWWQISKFTLNDGQIWFTRSLAQITEDSKIPKRSVERYLQDFEKAGFIEKTNRLFKKKHLYIRITEKLLAILNIASDIKTPKLIEQPTKSEINLQKTPDKSLFLAQFGDTDSAKLAVSIYKEKDSNSLNNSTVSQPCIVDNLKPKLQEHPTNSTYPIEKQIGERITNRFKNYIKGTIQNLQSQHKLVFSNPDQLFAEIVFSILHVDNQFPGITDNHHRVNLIAKLLRDKRWRTPKGFYNHWDVGQVYKLKLEQQAGAQQRFKRKELQTCEIAYDTSNTIDYGCHSNNVPPAVSSHQLQAKLKPLKSEYNELTLQLTTETRYLNNMESRFLKKPDPITKQVINSTAIKIAQLHEKVTWLEQQMKQYQEAA